MMLKLIFLTLLIFSCLLGSTQIGSLCGFELAENTCNNPKPICSLPVSYETNFDSSVDPKESWLKFSVTSTNFNIAITSNINIIEEIEVYGPFSHYSNNLCKGGSVITDVTYQVNPVQYTTFINIAEGPGVYVVKLKHSLPNECFTVSDAMTLRSPPPGSVGTTLDCSCNTDFTCNTKINLNESPCFAINCTGDEPNLGLYFSFNNSIANQTLVYTPSYNVSNSTFDYDIYELNGSTCADVTSSGTPIYSGTGVTSFIQNIATTGDFIIVLRNMNDFEIGGCFDLVETPEKCESCIGSFAPEAGEKFLITAWTQEETFSIGTTEFINPEIYLDFDLIDGITTTVLGPFKAQGAIIEGWQRIEEEFVVPADAKSIKVRLTSLDGNVYYDDIRFLPFDASMKSFVYDPINMRLSTELDERHYATFYEYDEEGKLIRIKKETEKGVMTIQETKSNAAK